MTQNLSPELLNELKNSLDEKKIDLDRELVLLAKEDSFADPDRTVGNAEEADEASEETSHIENDLEEKDPNVVKVHTSDKIKNEIFSKALDFFRTSNKPLNKQTYHHVGIYAFTNKALIRYVSLKRTKLEIERKLEQMRALENQMQIDVGYIDACPLSVDTEADLKAVKKLMEN